MQGLTAMNANKLIGKIQPRERGAHNITKCYREEHIKMTHNIGKDAQPFH